MECRDTIRRQLIFCAGAAAAQKRSDTQSVSQQLLHLCAACHLAPCTVSLQQTDDGVGRTSGRPPSAPTGALQPDSLVLIARLTADQADFVN